MEARAASAPVWPCSTAARGTPPRGRPTKRPASRTGAKSDALDAIRAAVKPSARSTWPPRAGVASGRPAGAADHPTLPHPGPSGRHRPAQGPDRRRPEELRAELRGRNTATQVDYCASLRPRPTRSLEHQATVRALGATAARIQLLQAEADQLQAELTTLVGAIAPGCWRFPASAPQRRPSAGQLVAGRTPPLRGGLCRPGRHQPDPGLLGAGDPLPAQPRRGPPAQPGLAHHLAVRLRIDPDTRAYTARRTAEARAAAMPSGACGVSSPASCSGCWNATTSPRSRSSGQLDST